MFLIRQKLYLTWSNYIEKASKEQNWALWNSESVTITSQNDSLSRRAPIGSRMTNHLIQIGTSKCVSWIIWYRSGRQSNSAEAGMHKPEGGKSPQSPPTNRTLYKCVCVYIYMCIYTHADTVPWKGFCTLLVFCFSYLSHTHIYIFQIIKLILILHKENQCKYKMQFWNNSLID